MFHLAGSPIKASPGCSQPAWVSLCCSPTWLSEIVYRTGSHLRMSGLPVRPTHASFQPTLRGAHPRGEDVVHCTPQAGYDSSPTPRGVSCRLADALHRHECETTHGCFKIRAFLARAEISVTAQHSARPLLSQSPTVHRMHQVRRTNSCYSRDDVILPSNLDLRARLISTWQPNLPCLHPPARARERRVAAAGRPECSRGRPGWRDRWDRHQEAGQGPG